MEEIRNCANKLVCMGDAASGEIEAVYKRHRTRTILQVGSVFTVEHDGIITDILRISSTEFKVNSHFSVA